MSNPTHTPKERKKRSKKATPKQKRKVAKVLGEAKEGKLKSSSGKKVTSRQQAVAIALSEAGLSKKKKKGKKR